MSSPRAAPSLDLVFAALADPTRRAILERIASGAASVGDLVAPSELSQPTISKHLKVLERAGLVFRGRVAQSRPVHLNAAPLAEAARWLSDYRGFWEHSLNQLESYVKTLQHKEREHAEGRKPRRTHKRKPER